MTAREYLSQIKTLDIVIDQKRQELDNLHDIATAIGSFDYSRDRVQVSPSLDAPFTKTAERAAELDKEISILEANRLGIISQIHNLDNPQHIIILYKRFVQMKTLSTIADECGYSYDRAKHLSSYALKEFESRHPHNTTTNVIV